MAYATVADLVARYTEPTIAGLTDLTRVGSVNAEIAQQGLMMPPPKSTAIWHRAMNCRCLPLCAC